MSGAAATAPRRRLDPAVITFAVATGATAVLLVVWLGELTFWRDEWGFLLHRRGSSPGVFLEPHYEHIAVSLIAVYKGLLQVFGMDSPRPFQVVAVLSFLGSLTLVFVYARRCVGGWLALAGVLPILVLGPAWDDVLWPFQIGFFSSMCAGVGALLALERRDRVGDVVACVLFVVSLSFSSLGVPFAFGAALSVGLDSERRRRAWIAAIPIALYALWWLGYGRHADTYVSLHNLLTSPSYILDGFASSLASLLGLATPTQVVASPLDWGRALLVAAVGLGLWRVKVAGMPGRRFWVVLGIAVAFWFLAGVNASIFREPSSGRYQYMGAIFIVLIAAELLRGVRVGRWVAAAALALAATAALANLSSLHIAWQGLTGFGELQPADLAALELTRDVVDPEFQLDEENSGVDYLGFMDAGSYFSAVDAFGSPAYTPAELAAASEPAREAADKVFAAALGVGLAPGATVPTDASCRTATLGRSAKPVALTGGEVAISALRGDVTVDGRRYASEAFPIEFGSVAAGETATMTIPADGSTEPWELGLSGSGRARICEAGG